MSRFAPIPPVERRIEVEAGLHAKLDHFAEIARQRIADEQEPERLAEQLRAHGWKVIEPASTVTADVRSLNVG